MCKLVDGHGGSGSFGCGLSMAGQGMSSRARRAKLARDGEMLINLQSARLGSILMALPLSATILPSHHGRPDPGDFQRRHVVRPRSPDHRPRPFSRRRRGGCIAAMHSAGALVVAFIVAMMAGVALHLNGATVAGGGNSRRSFSHRARSVDVEPATDLQRGRARALRACRPRARLCAGKVDLRRRANSAFTRICLASRSFKTRLHSPPWRPCAALPDNPRTFRRCDLSVRASPVLGLAVLMQQVVPAA